MTESLPPPNPHETPKNGGRRGPVAEPEFEALAPLAPPGLLGRLDPARRQALLAVIAAEKDLAPNPEGLGGKGAAGQERARQLARHKKRAMVATRYLEEGIMVLHVREGKKLPEVARLLGYSYGHVHATWYRMRARSLRAEGVEEVNEEVRQFVVRHLRYAVEIAAEHVDENAAYGAVLIRGCEALAEIQGLESEEARSLNVAELAEAVRGRSPLLLEVVGHSQEARRLEDAGKGAGAE